MKDISNARLVAWTNADDERRVAVRNHRVSPWRMAGDTKYHYRSTEEIQDFAEAGTDHYIEEFPVPTLAEIVGDAKVFTAMSARDKSPYIFWRDDHGNTWGYCPMKGSYAVGHDPLDYLRFIDLSTVTPYYPRQS